MIQEVELLRQANQLHDFYVAQYESRYQTKPIAPFEDQDRRFLKYLVQQFGYNKAASLISAYLSSQDEWFQKKAHSLSVLRTNIDVLNTELARNEESRTEKPVYVVALSESGRPVCSHNKDIMRNTPNYYPPLLFDDWVKATVDEKLPGKWAIHEKRFDWEENWKTWKYLQEGNGSSPVIK